MDVGHASSRPAASGSVRGIVRDTGEGYDEFPTRLATASGIGTPTPADASAADRIQTPVSSAAVAFASAHRHGQSVVRDLGCVDHRVTADGPNRS